jgi:hypothetical protein
MSDGLPLFDWEPPPLMLATPLYTINRDNKFDIQLNVANLREHKLGRLLGGGKIELKSETWQWRRTGNFALEYEQRGRASGFKVSQADAWTQELNDDEGKILCDLMFPLARVKELARYTARRNPHCIRRGGGDSGAVSNVVVPLHFFADWLLQGGGE